MKYAHIGSTNQILGWYDADIHTTIPTPNIAVDDDVWLQALESNHNKINEDGTTEQADFRTDGEKAEDMRVTRNLLLQMEVDPIVTNPLRWGDMTSAQQAEWVAYRQALLDLPQQAGFPHDVTWPTKP